MTKLYATFVFFFCALSVGSGFTTSSSFVPRRRITLTRPSASPLSLSMSAGGVVITGGANGVGFAYAGEFMDRGYDVVICDIQDCTAAAIALTNRHPNGKVFHTKCDVSDSESVQNLGDFAKSKLGTVNYWINNAGINGGRRALRDVPVSQVELVVKVNLLGILLCTKVAMDIMAEQVGYRMILLDIDCSVVRYLIYMHKGWGNRPYFQYGRQRRQRWRYSGLRYVRSN
jgi:chlorophyll(ide) b reductase